MQCRAAPKTNHIRTSSQSTAKRSNTPKKRTRPPPDHREKEISTIITRIFLYYRGAINSTMLTTIGNIATQQYYPTKNTMRDLYQFLDYAATHPDAIITFHDIDMVLSGHSDVYCLSESKARSRVGSHFSLSKNSSEPPNNGAILTVNQIIKAVMSSAAEADLGALYINFREAIPARQILIAMVNPQPPTKMQTDNTTSLRLVNNTIAPRRTKAMDMRFHWLRCQKLQQTFCHCW